MVGNGPLTLWTELDRATSLLQLHQELLDSLLAQIEILRAERDDARMVRMLLLEIRAKQDQLLDQLAMVGIP